MKNQPKLNNFEVQVGCPALAVQQPIFATPLHTNYYQGFPTFSPSPFHPYASPYLYDLFYNPYQPPVFQPGHYHSFQAQQTNIPHQLKPQPIQRLSSTINESAEAQSSSSSEGPKGRLSKESLKRSTQGKMVEGSKYKINKKGKKNFTSYYWSLQQNKRYSEFLKLHPGLFDLSVSEKKNLRVNVMMSKKIKSRTPQQCHSHHQKMVKKYGIIENIIAGLRDQREQILEGKKLARDQVKDQVGIEQLNHDL